jgi:hypothetical protein
MAKRVLTVSVFVSLLAAVIAAEAQQPAESAATSTPQLLLIYREEVKPGRGAAHAANEASWAGAYARLNAPEGWLGMTTVAGPSEAWFLSGYASYEEYEKVQVAMEANAAVTAEGDKHSAADGELLNRTSTLLASYRPALSYQPGARLPEMRYMQVDVVRVKPGFDSDFRAAWRSIVESHTTAKMDERWAVYEIDAGGSDLTFFFFYPRKSLAEIDKTGPMHSASAYRDAVGESGRARQREVMQKSIESSQTYIFKLRPQMSRLPKEWIDADPGFWTAKPPAPPMTASKAAKK